MTDTKMMNDWGNKWINMAEAKVISEDGSDFILLDDWDTLALPDIIKEWMFECGLIEEQEYHVDCPGLGKQYYPSWYKPFGEWIDSKAQAVSA